MNWEIKAFMQDSYVGDVGDFGKFCLLNEVYHSSHKNIKMGINWYYITKHDNNGYGNQTNYLKETNKVWQKYRSCSPDLYDKLKNIMLSRRSIWAIESNNIMPKGTIFFSKPISSSSFSVSERIKNREIWFKESLSELQRADIIFLDPDNGIQIDLSKKAQPIAVKYAFIDEIEKYYSLGKTLIVYNHRDRRPTVEYKTKISSPKQFLYSQRNIKVLRFKRMSVRDYIFIIQDQHLELINYAFSRLTSEPYNFLFDEYHLLKGGSMPRRKKYWTNPSVLRLAGDSDPIDLIRRKARQGVLRALEEGWEGPPFDPFKLAEFLKIPTVPNEDLFEANIVPLGSNRYQIEFNPNKPLARTRFSLAHELAHTLFPDCRNSIRNRGISSQIRPDNWQLELLCNLAAAEFLMPVGTGTELENEPVTIDNILRLKNEYQVSTETISLRLIDLTSEPCTVFVAARNSDEKQSDFRIDYSITSRSSKLNIPKGFTISPKSKLSECVAVGFTAKGTEHWGSHLPELSIECVGIPPYPDRIFPRIVGIARSKKASRIKGLHIIYLSGDALAPRGSDHRIITHIVNDKTPNWGAGFGRAVKTEFPSAQNSFRQWVERDRDNLKLGMVYRSTIDDNMSIVQMVAQHGYGPSKKPRIRYAALQECLDKLAIIALQHKASVHMPKIGTGYAGGNWYMIAQLIDEAIVRKGTKVTVYELPNQNVSKRKFMQGSLCFPYRT